MTKKDDGNAVAVRPPFEVDMPDNAPPLGFDPGAESFSWRDVLPSNYWNLDLLDEKIAALGGNPVLTPARIVIKPVEDPEVPEALQDLSPRIVMEFAESAPALVFNKTRCTLMARITGTQNPARWIGNLGELRLELYAGAARDFSTAMQILFRPVTANGDGKAADIGAVNDELFG